MISFLEIISFIFIVSIFFISRDHKKISLEDKLKELVKWCIIDKGQNGDQFKENLYQSINEIQTKLNISPEYRLSSENEWKTVKTILEDFQKRILLLYFSDKLPTPKIKSNYDLKNETCFIYLLQLYLNEHKNDCSFLGHDMQLKSIKSTDNHSSEPSKNLTDFSLIFNKLYYITYIYCKNNSILNPKGKNWNDEAKIENFVKISQSLTK